MKKILIINSSKRKNGNSYALEKRFAELLNGKAEVTTFRIGEKEVRACLACDGCKRQHTPNCVQKDDFSSLIPEIDSCDAMLILAPVHWDQFPAQLKAFLVLSACHGKIRLGEIHEGIGPVKKRL